MVWIWESSGSLFESGVSSKTHISGRLHLGIRVLSANGGAWGQDVGYWSPALLSFFPSSYAWCCSSSITIRETRVPNFDLLAFE